MGDNIVTNRMASATSIAVVIASITLLASFLEWWKSTDHASYEINHDME